MERNNYQQMNTRKQVKIIAATDLFAVIGAVFGVIVYYLHWFG